MELTRRVDRAQQEAERVLDRLTSALGWSYMIQGSHDNTEAPDEIDVYVYAEIITADQKVGQLAWVRVMDDYTRIRFEHMEDNCWAVQVP